jgi:hypothetical protein
MAMLAGMNATNSLPSTNTYVPRKRLPKEEGDISSVFASLTGDTAQELPPHFSQLKRQIIGEHGDAILASWKRLIPVVEAKVREANERGPSIFPEVQFEDVKNNNIDEATIKRIKQTGVCIIRNTIPKSEAAELLSDIRKYIKDNPTTKGINHFTFKTNVRIPRKGSSDLGIVLVSEPASCAGASKYLGDNNLAQHRVLPH